MRIAMRTPIVEIDGDEMTRVVWQWIKELLLEPFVDLKTEYYDLGLPYRDKTDDKVTVDAANAIKKYRVGVKCATITPNDDRLKEYNLKRLYKSPNATLRAALDGTIFRTPILCGGIVPLIAGWKKPITIARHAYGDVYKNVEMSAEAGENAELVLGGRRETVFNFSGGGIVQAMHNTDKSIESFARACFEYALSLKQPLWFGTKDTISKIYDGRFKQIFARVYEEYAEAFEGAGIYYDYTLIDDSVARVMRSNGGFIWALKNYDGDVLSDMAATIFGSLAMMSSVLVSPSGEYEYEAAHGTVTRHYYRHLKGEKTGTNPIATIFAWTGALAKRGELDNLPSLTAFARRLERASLEVIEGGQMTGDLIPLYSREGIKPSAVCTREFLSLIAERLSAKPA